MYGINWILKNTFYGDFGGTGRRNPIPKTVIWICRINIRSHGNHFAIGYAMSPEFDVV